MQVAFLGHACFVVTLRSGRTLLFDPYEPDGLGGRLRYRPVEVAPDYVLITHEHRDHADLSWVAGEPRIVRDSMAHADFSIDVWHAAHDELGGRLRGGHTRLFSLAADGAHLVHCGDIGERLTPDRLVDWPQVDVLIAPTGGYFTIGAAGAAELVRMVRPRFAIPCHYRTEAIELSELLTVDRFTRRFEGDRVRQRRVLDLDAEAGGDDTVIVVLEPLGAGESGD